MGHRKPPLATWWAVVLHRPGQLDWDIEIVPTREDAEDYVRIHTDNNRYPGGTFTVEPRQVEVNR